MDQTDQKYPDIFIEPPPGFRDSDGSERANTELTTRLTRVKQSKDVNSKTQTRLEQTLRTGDKSATINDDKSSGSRDSKRGQIRTQVTFDSDSDSLTGSGRADAKLAKDPASKSSDPKRTKRSKSELITRTKYLRYQNNSPTKDAGSGPNDEANYDYSIYVNRLRNQKVDKRVR